MPKGGNAHIMNKVMLNDIHTLQLAPRPKMFAKLLELFRQKFESCPQVQGFFSYFITSWCERNSKWFEGVRDRMPSTNNAVESFNNVIKKAYTLRKRLHLGEFFKVMLDMVESESKMRCQTSPNYKVFQLERIISDQCWIQSYEFSRTSEDLFILRVILSFLS